MDIQTVHLIFKTHLDIGYTDTSANVTRQYFEEYIPRALQTAREMRERGGPERFRWTTGSWLIYEYLEAASPEQRAGMEAAIAAGDILWHALPFTTHTELMSPALFEFGLGFARKLDQRYGRVTTAAKMTDVPGHTRGIVPLLAGAGVRFLHIGVNEGSTMPEVPPVFRWKGPGGLEIVVMYEQGYGGATTVPGLTHALAFGHTIDNLGPQTSAEVLDVWAHTQARFPGAQVTASTLDDFADALVPLRENLPVVTAEIGDTWIHGTGSDPAKLANVRTELDLLNATWAAHPASQTDITDERARLLAVNQALWDIEDHIRLKEKAQAFDAEFIELARSVYFRNDERAAVKREINLKLGSQLVEEKSYQDYRAV